MASLKTQYMGLTLANPVIAGASDLTANVDTIKRIEDAGAGALVLKSLFEEQIQLERLKLEEDLSKDDNLYGEMATIFPRLEHAGAREHLLWVKKSRSAVKIPVIASLNAVERRTWAEYARQLADQGVDGLELNFFASPRDAEIGGAIIEEEQLDAVRDVRAQVKIPIAVKLSLFYSNPLNIVSRLDREGVDGFVLFNRFFQPDISVETESMTQPFNFSTTVDNRLPLRFAGLLYGRIRADVCASTGIVSGADVTKMLLAGAAAVQVVTGLYRNGVKSIRGMLDELERWMDGRGYATIDAFRGKLSAQRSSDPWAYTRAQYAKMLLSPKEFAEPVHA
ncbi:MAG TPA: dihydroorotate dehydrogenase-like protein [Spirochaetia bacterium]